jgi:hypothetical protein
MNVWYEIKYVASTTAEPLNLVVQHDRPRYTLLPKFHLWLENSDCTGAQYPCWILKKLDTNSGAIEDDRVM